MKKASPPHQTFHRKRDIVKKNEIPWYVPLAAFLLLAACIFVKNPFSRVSYFLQDLLYQMPGKVVEGLYILPAGSEPDTGAALRAQTAQIIAALNADPDARPAVIGVDVPLYGRSQEEADKALEQAVIGAGNIVLSSLIHYDHQIIRDHGRLVLNGTAISGMQDPVPPLDTASVNGFTNVFLDSDGRVRHGLLRAEYEGRSASHFAYAVYEKYLSGREPAEPPLDRHNMWYVDFSGKPGAFHVGVTWEDVLEGRVPASSFKNAIVLLTVPNGGAELFRTPLGQQNGTEVYANMLQDLILGVRKREVPRLLQALILLALLFGCHLAYQRRDLLSVLALIGGVILWPVLCVILYHLGLVFDPLYPPLFAAALFAYHLAYDGIIEMRQRIRVRKTLRRYLSPPMANQLLLNHVSLEKPEKRDIAVLFVDIRGFTPLSESLAPSQMAEVLKEYLTLTSTAIFHNGGTLDKFIGDATMGFFNAPLEQEDYVYHAVKAAMEIAAGGERIRETFHKKFGRNIYFGIGVHFGPAVVGEIGPDYRKDYTAVGDTVNTASRLESNAKPGEVLVSLRVCEALEGRLKASFVGERQIKGKSKPMMLYRVDSLDGVTPPAPVAD